MSESKVVPFADLSAQWEQIRQSFLPDLQKLFLDSTFCVGPPTVQFETAIASYLGVRHAIAVNSGTSAIHLAVKTAGIRHGDKVLVPSHTFIGTVWGLLYEGAEPVLCDVEPETGNIDLKDAAKRMQPGVKAILPVHIYGQPADMTAVLDFAATHRLTIIEDAAQAIGARFNGRSVGCIGKLGCFSFYPTKNLGAAGRGGLVVTDDDALAHQLRVLREHGQTNRYVHAEVGYNYRMDGIQALVLSHKLAYLDQWTAQRRSLAARYTAAFSDLPVSIPRVADRDHVYHLYVLLTERRDSLRENLGADGIQTGLHYPLPLHRQPCLEKLKLNLNSFPVADRFAAHGISLPLFIGMTNAQQDQVIEAVRKHFGSKFVKG